MIHFSSDVFITVELIPLNPDINEYPLTYKPIPFICELDRVIIEQKGECRLHSLYREPHQCSIETTAKAVAPSRNLPGVTSEPKPLIVSTGALKLSLEKSSCLRFKRIQYRPTAFEKCLLNESGP